MSKILNHKNLSETLGLTECTDGFWLYDKTRGMNLAMRAKTAELAFVEALTYYQNRLSKVETEYKELNQKVQGFVEQFQDKDDEWSSQYR